MFSILMYPLISEIERSRGRWLSPDYNHIIAEKYTPKHNMRIADLALKTN